MAKQNPPQKIYIKTKNKLFEIKKMKHLFKINKYIYI